LSSSVEINQHEEVKKGYREYFEKLR